MALGRGDAQQRRAHTVDNDGEQRRAQRDQCGVRVAAEIDHVADGGRHRGVQLRHDEHTEKLSTAAMITAGRIRRHLVVTQVAMALGASVSRSRK